MRKDSQYFISQFFALLGAQGKLMPVRSIGPKFFQALFELFKLIFKLSFPASLKLKLRLHQTDGVYDTSSCILMKFTRHIHWSVLQSNWSRLLRIRQWGFLIRMNLQLRVTLDTFVLGNFISLSSRISLQHQLYDKRRSKILSHVSSEKLRNYPHLNTNIICRVPSLIKQIYKDDSLRDSHCGRPIL